MQKIQSSRTSPCFDLRYLYTNACIWYDLNMFFNIFIARTLDLQGAQFYFGNADLFDFVIK